jgi:hypothetical protein
MCIYKLCVATSRMYFLEDEIEQNFLRNLLLIRVVLVTKCDSSGTDNLTVGEVISAKYSDEESAVHFSAACSAPSAIFTWEDMTNYVGQRE